MIPHNHVLHTTEPGHPLEKVPEPLKSRKCWMGTKFERRSDEKLNKPPYRVRAGQSVIKADNRNPDNWASFKEACEALLAGTVDAIGYVFTDRDNFTVVDLDDAIDPETGVIDSQASKVIDSLDSYWEISVSGTGLHAIGVATKPGEDCRRDDIGVEVYDGSTGARFMVMTGRALTDQGTQPCQDALNTLYREWWPEEKKRQRPHRPSTALNLSDTELLDSARRARKTGAKFEKLYDRGDWSGYKSQSNADYGLINLLTYRCAGDRDRIIDLFKRSALYRPPPEKARNYVEKSVDKFLRGYTGDYYQPRAVREKPVAEQRDILTPYLADLLDLSRWKGPKASGAWKVYAYMIIQTAELGVEANTGELVTGGDVRTIAEGSGLTRTTVARSSLPYLVETKRIKWRKGSGQKASTFVLLPPPFSRSDDITVNTQEYCNVITSGNEHDTTVNTQEHFNGVSWGNGLDVLKKLIRMRSGSAITGRSRRIGTMERVSRLGMVAMFCMVTLTATPRVQTLAEIVERTGRDKYRIREAMDKLKGAGVVVEVREDAFTLAEGFWTAYDRELKRSLIVDAERRQRKQHQQERRDNGLKLKAGRANWRAKHDPKVISLAAKRRKDMDREARLNQPEADEHLTEWQKAQRGQEAMMRDYDRMCARVQERLARRGGCSA